MEACLTQRIRCVGSCALCRGLVLGLPNDPYDEVQPQLGWEFRRGLGQLLDSKTPQMGSLPLRTQRLVISPTRLDIKILCRHELLYCAFVYEE